MNPSTRIRAVIFDMDGVLTDSEPLINAAAIAMFREKGLTVMPADFLPFVGTGEDRYIGGVAEKYGLPLDLPLAKKRTYEIYLGLVPAQLHVFSGAVELVKACREGGLRVAVASSADRIKITANLQKIGLPIPSWDAVVAGEEVSAKKPAPDIFLTAAVKLGVSPAESVVVEDAVNGIQAAKAAQMRCVAVAQTFPRDRLQAADVVRVRISEVTLEDLLGPTGRDASSGLPPVVKESPTRGRTGPWGILPTFGLAAAVAVAYVAIQAVVALIWAFIAAITHHGKLPKGWESSGLLLALATCASAPVAFGFTWLFAHLRKAMPAAEYLGFRRVSVRTMAPWTLALLALVAGSDFLTVSLGRPIVPPFMQTAYLTAQFVPLLWLALLVAAPLAEETLFRGFLFVGILNSRLGALGAVGITSLVWASIHLQYDAYGMGTVFVTGLLLGFVRLRTGSLYPTIFLHFLMNFIASLETVCVLGARVF